MPFLRLNGRALHYERTGNGNSRVVFLHGGLVDARLWDPQIDWFGARAEVIRLDLPGNGRSESLVDAHDGAEFLRDVLDLLEVARPSIIGLSGGARLAIDFSISHPTRIENLVAVAPGLSGYDQWMLPRAQLSAVRDALRLGHRDRAAEAWLDLWAPVTKRALLELGRENAESLFTNVQLTALSPPAIARLTEITAPTLVVTGDRDVGDIQTIAELLVAGVPGAKKHVMDGADHFPNVHDPATFNQIVGAFLGLSEPPASEP